MLLRCLRALVVGSLIAGFVLLVPQSSTAAPALNLSRTTAIAGEFVVLTGAVSARGTRPVVLQRRQARAWVAVTSTRTDRTGAFRFRYRVPATTTLRVLAPPTRTGTRRVIAAATVSRTVTAVAPTARIAAPAAATSTAPVTVAGAFGPARPGRATQVQRRDGTRWTTLATGIQDRAGASRYPLRLAPGTYDLRVRTLASAGAPETVSAPRRLVVSAPPATPGPPEVPAQPEESLPTSDACGPVTPKQDGTAWRCTLAEDFDGTAYDKLRWFPQQTFASGTPDAFACYRNTPQTISVGGGMLSLSVLRVEQPTSCTFGGLSRSTKIIAGSLMSYQRFTQQYGKFEARIRSERAAFPGLQEAFWMWPDDRVPSADKWPVAGEIDVSETYSINNDLTIPFLHYRADAQGPQAGLNTAYCAAARGAWNTYTLIWTAERIEILVNGRSCLVNTSGDSAFRKPYQLAFTQMLGAGANAYDGRIPLPATMQVDYVRAWA